MEPYVYRLKKLNGKWDEGYYHAEELTPVKAKHMKELHDKVIKRFRKNKKKVKLVSIKGYGP